MEDNRIYLKETHYFDYSHPHVQELISDIDSTHLEMSEKVQALYLKVRDGWRYNAYRISLDSDNYKASAIISRPEGHCIEKAIVLIAGLRALGIPARLRLAKVTNHIAVERLMERLGTNILPPHGMVDIFMNGSWLKATPAFNKALCEKCNVLPLEFDGMRDSIFQGFNDDGDKFMEYLEDYGPFDDVPLHFMIKNLQEHYPGVFDKGNQKMEYHF
ncbi:MAG: transglutaminase domain-containing protein [Croceivirga sp.]